MFFFFLLEKDHNNCNAQVRGSKGAAFRNERGAGHTASVCSKATNPKSDALLGCVRKRTNPERARAALSEIFRFRALDAERPKTEPAKAKTAASESFCFRALVSNMLSLRNPQLICLHS